VWPLPSLVFPVLLGTAYAPLASCRPLSNWVGQFDGDVKKLSVGFLPDAQMPALGVQCLPTGG
jgi:hypothetical protein